MQLKICAVVLSVFCGCCFNVLILEELLIVVPGVANLATFLQFLFIAAEGFIFTSKFGTKNPIIPIRDCAYLVGLFFVTSVCNNYAYNFNIPTPLHIIIKSGSLVANMVMGILLRDKKYTFKKFVSVVLITLGIIICTLYSGNSIAKSNESSRHIIQWCFGIVLLLSALFLSAIMGLLQESLYLNYGKHPNDMLYYSHLLPLPFFVFLSSDIISVAKMSLGSAPVSIPLFGNMSYACVLLAANAFTQYICIRSVYLLTSECTSLTVTLILTLRKFLSLVLSVIFYNNNFTFYHWIGTALVFFGTTLFIDFNSTKKKVI